MRLLDRVRDRYSYRDTGYYEGMASGASVLFEYSGGNNREQTQKDLISAAKQAYQTNGVVFACILARALLLSEATFKFRSLTDKHLFGNDDLRILEYPWPNGRTGDLWMRMEEDASLAGNAYIWQVAPDMLWRLPPHEMIIISRQVSDGMGRTHREIIGYDWDPGPPAPGMPKLPPQHFTVDEIAHWTPIPDPAANFRGMSWLQPVLMDVNGDAAITEYKTKYFRHGTPITAVKYAAKLRPETIDSVVDRMGKKYGGVGNAWRPLIFDQGADPVMGRGLQDLDLRAVAAAGEERICAAAGVPPIVIGLKNAETGESYQTAMRRFADLTVRPLWRSGCAALEKLVPNIPDRGVQLWFDTSDISALQAAETERAQVVQVKAAATLTLVQAGFTRQSVMACIDSGDWSQLVPDPNAPTPGVQERETVNVADMGPPDTGPGSGQDSNATSVTRPARQGTPPGGGQTLTQPQTPASKKPMPASIPTMPTANGKG